MLPQEHSANFWNILPCLLMNLNFPRVCIIHVCPLNFSTHLHSCPQCIYTVKLTSKCLYTRVISISYQTVLLTDLVFWHHFLLNVFPGKVLSTVLNLELSWQADDGAAGTADMFPLIRPRCINHPECHPKAPLPYECAALAQLTQEVIP